MKVTKWVEFETEVGIEIGLAEISAAIGEAWQRIQPDKYEEHPTRNDVIAAMSRSLVFFKAMKDEQIAILTPRAASGSPRDFGGIGSTIRTRRTIQASNRVMQ